jgi:K(+)-stimulated pyrophosphate-energized sodium pump
MSGLTRAASGDTLDLSGANISYVVVVAAIALVALGFAVALRSSVLATGQGTEKMQGIAAAVQEGASAFLTRQFKTLAAFAVLALVLLSLLPADTASIRIGRSVFFLVGAGFSSFIAYAGMGLATRANLRVAAAAREADGAAQAMKIAFRTGGVVGFLTVGLGLLGAATVVLIYKGDAPTVLEGFGFGALADVADLVDAEAVPPGVGLAVISGLVDDVAVEPGRDSGVVVRMTWPTA